MSSGSASPRARVDRRMEILDAAAEIFSAKGFGSTTIDDVAKSIGATKGSVYYYFSSKGDLFFSVHSHAMDINFAAITPIARNKNIDTVERLWKMCSTHVLSIVNNFAYQRVTIQGIELHMTSSTTAEERKKIDELMSQRDEYEDLFQEVLEECSRTRSHLRHKADLIVKPLLGSLNWTTVWYRPNRSESDSERERMASAIADYAIFGVLGQSGHGSVGGDTSERN